MATEAQKRHREGLRALLNAHVPDALLSGDIREDYATFLALVQRSSKARAAKDEVTSKWRVSFPGDVVGVTEISPHIDRVDNYLRDEDAERKRDAEVQQRIDNSGGDSWQRSTPIPEKPQPTTRDSGFAEPTPARPKESTPPEGAADGPSTPSTPTTSTMAPPTGSTSAGGSTGGGGGGSPAGGGGGSAPAGASGDPVTGDGTPVQLPAAEQAELWLIDGGTYIVAWKIPNTSTTLFYNVDNAATLNAVFQGNPMVDREITTDGSTDPATWLERQGLGFFGGQVSEIQNTDGHPWDAASREWVTKSEFVPWLNDPEVLAWLAEGIIEQDGRQLTPQAAREAGFGFAEGKSNAELTRELEVFAMSETELFNGTETVRQGVEQTLSALGFQLGGPGETALVEWMTQRVFSGRWSNSDVLTNGRLMLDPALRDRVDPELREFMDGTGDEFAPTRLDILAGYRKLAEQWVGPAVAKNLSDEYLRSFVTRELQGDVDVKAEFEDVLRGLRMANFGAFGDNPNLRYEDVAPTYRTLYANTWGEMPDESSTFFYKMMQGNDLEAAEQTLRSEGIKRGNKRVTQDVQKQLIASFGGVHNPINV